MKLLVDVVAGQEDAALVLFHGHCAVHDAEIYGTGTDVYDHGVVQCAEPIGHGEGLGALDGVDERLGLPLPGDEEEAATRRMARLQQGRGDGVGATELVEEPTVQILGLECLLNLVDPVLRAE